ncbi:ABC transporter permease [Desemzia incerta]|uniref:ABC transporter permease n=1 Tax=Desemzia incerta TaxID=82801 RepID=UPI00331610B9
MNIIQKLTVKQLRLNKKRTFITIVGVVVSVAMITAVSSLGVSFMDLMQRQVIADDGEWHVRYENIDSSQMEAIKNDETTEEVLLTQDEGYAYLEGSQNQNKPYLFIKNYNSAAYKHFPIELHEGKFPEKENEWVISESIQSNGKVAYSIGDTVTVDIGQRTVLNDAGEEVVLTQTEKLQTVENFREQLVTEESKTYTIVGIMERPAWENTWAPGYTVLSYVDESTVGKDTNVHASIILKKLEPALFDHAKQVAKVNGIEKVEFHDALLRYYGVVSNDRVRRMLIILSVTVLLIIVVGSISLIYNAFAISVSERSKQLGMLSSIGATKKQKKEAVFFEGAVVGAISIPIGLISGLAGIQITFIFMNSLIKEALGITEELTLVFNPLTILTAIVLSILTIMISTYIPAKKASDISAIEAIRQTSDVKLSRNTIRNPGFIRSLFGVEGDLALKNIKRNKTSYRAIVLSLCMSIILFLSVSYFTITLAKSIELSQQGIDHDIYVSLNQEDDEMGKETIANLNSLENITETTSVLSFDAMTWIKEEAVPEKLKQENNESMVDGKYPYYITLNALDNESFETYAKSLNLDKTALTDENNPAAIIIDTIQYEEAGTNKYVETKALKTAIGEILDIEMYDFEQDKSISLLPFEVATLTDKTPMGISDMMGLGTFNVIISEELLLQLKNNESLVAENLNKMLYIRSNDPLALQDDIEELQETTEQNNFTFYNLYAGRQREEQLLVLVSVFTYAFIFLITVVCIATIFNTISTGIVLRKKEFAVLKSIGMTPKSFMKMIYFESLFYGLKALLYGIPVSVAIIWGIYLTWAAKFSFDFQLPWTRFIYAVFGVFFIVLIAMFYSSRKIRKETIIDALKQDNV